MKEKVEFARFPTKSLDGRIFIIIGYQYYMSSDAPAHGLPVLLKGDIEYWTDSGLPVRKIDSETYRVATSKETLSRFY